MGGPGGDHSATALSTCFLNPANEASARLRIGYRLGIERRFSARSRDCTFGECSIRSIRCSARFTASGSARSNEWHRSLTSKQSAITRRASISSRVAGCKFLYSYSQFPAPAANAPSEAYIRFVRAPQRKELRVLCRAQCQTVACGLHHVHSIRISAVSRKSCREVVRPYQEGHSAFLQLVLSVGSYTREPPAFIIFVLFAPIDALLVDERVFLNKVIWVIGNRGEVVRRGPNASC